MIAGRQAEQPAAGSRPAPGAPPRARSGHRVWLPVGLLLAGALHALLLFVDWNPSPRRLWGDETMYADVAERRARGEPAEPELLWPPLYPKLLAPAARLGPLAQGSAHGRWPVWLVQAALLGFAAWALRRLAHGLTGSAVAADTAMLLFLLDPHTAAFAHYLWPEVLHLAAFLGALALLAAPAAGATGATPGPRRQAPAGGGWLGLTAAGVLLGVAVLAKNLLQPYLPLVAWPLVAAHGLRRGLARAAWVGLVAGLLVWPTLAANQRRGEGFRLASSARFNLWVGLNDRSPRNLVDEIVGDEWRRWQAAGATFAERETYLQARIDAFLAERGWMSVLRAQLGRQYRRLFDGETFLTDQLPGGAIAAQGSGYVDPPAWAVSVLRASSHGHYALVLVLACLGWAWWPATAPRGAGPRAWAAFLGTFVLYNLALFLLLHVKTRYRLAFFPVFDLAAGAAWAAGLACGVRALWQLHPGRSAFALVAAALLLALAYAPRWLY